MSDHSIEYLEQMREHAGNALAFVKGMQRQDFVNDLRTQQAVLMSLLVIGEAAARVMERHPDLVLRYRIIPWESIRAMRNRIAHGYMSVDLNVAWDTVQHALPELQKALDDLPE